MQIYEINDCIRVSSNARREDDDLVVVREGDEEHVQERTLQDVEHAVRLLRVDLHPTVVLRDGLVGCVHERLVEIQYQLHSQTHINTERRALSCRPPSNQHQIRRTVEILTVYFFFFFFFSTC